MRLSRGRSGSTNPFKFRLLPGRYEVVVKSNEIAGGPSVKLTDINIEGTGQVTRIADFSTGTLRIGAIRGNELVDAVAVLTNLATNKDESSLRTYATTNTNPRTFDLLPGRYRIRLMPVKPGLRPQELEIEIKPGESVQRTVDFSR